MRIELSYVSVVSISKVVVKIFNFKRKFLILHSLHIPFIPNIMLKILHEIFKLSE